MKALIFIPFVLLLGMLIGSWPGRSDIARLESELAAAQALVTQQPRSSRGMSEVTSLLGIERSSEPSGQESAHREDSPTAGKQDAITDDEATTPRVAPASDSPTNAPAAPAEADATDATERDDAGMEADIDRAVELWKVRVDVARATFVSNTRLDDEQEVQFHAIVEAMNLRIGDTIDQFATELREAEDVQMETGVRLMNEVTEAIVLTYDEMDRSLPEEWREDSGEEFSLLDFIDPEVARPLTDVQDKLDTIGGRRH